MLDNSYDPQVVEIEVGDTVRFVNRGRVPHDAQDAGGKWKTALLDPEESEEVTFNEEGTYQMFCSLHSTEDDEGQRQGMVGTVVVGSGSAASTDAASAADASSEWSGTTRHVPADYPTIQSAVDA